MLVLSRREGEIIYIGDNILVMVTRLSPGKVRLGIAAPDGVPILRGELRGVVEDERPARLAGEVDEIGNPGGLKP